MDKLTSFINTRLATGCSISDKLAGILSTMIFQNEYPPNYMFPNENDFCKQLGIGRNSLRETYKILESNGFIRRTKRGTFVNDRETVLKNMPMSLAIRLTKDAKILEYRTMVECGIVEYAAERASEENLEHMELFIQQMLEHSNVASERIYYDYLFHFELAKAADNPLFITVMQPIQEYMLNPDNIKSNQERILRNTQNASAHHRSILEAVRRRDKVSARSALLAHMMDYSNYLSACEQAHNSDKPAQ